MLLDFVLLYNTWKCSFVVMILFLVFKSFMCGIFLMLKIDTVIVDCIDNGMLEMVWDFNCVNRNYGSLPSLSCDKTFLSDFDALGIVMFSAIYLKMKPAG